MHKTYKEVLAELLKIPAIDTHEHLRFGHMINFETLLEEPRTFSIDLRTIIIGEYMGTPLAGAAHAAGLDNIDSRASLLKALRACANTGSYRCGVEIPLRDLYDFDVSKLTESNWDELEAKVAEHYKNGPWAWTAEIFRRANIEKGLKINVSPSYFRQTLPSYSPGDRQIEQDLLTCLGAMDTFILQKPDPGEDSPAQQGYQRLAGEYGVDLAGLDGFVALIDKVVADYKALGACGIKSAAAYQRSLRVDFVDAAEAGKLYATANKDLSAEQRKRFGDFAWIEVARAAGRHDMPFQIHTGLVMGSGHLLTECNPALMKGLLNNPELAETKFVLIHTGYPYARHSVHLAWDLPNVWIDFVWLPTLSIEAGVGVLGEFLDWIPATKFTLGGDYKLPEGVYGSVLQSREVLALVLARKVEQGFWSISQAVEVGRKVLRENAQNLYKLSG